MKAVFEKELRLILMGLIGPLMISAVTAVVFLYFIFNNLIAGGNDLSAPMNASCVIALTFAVPFLTMRSFSEEKKTGTDRLYMTAPVSLSAVVIGKFLAYALILLIPTILSACLPLILIPYGNVQFWFCYSCILAFYLYALMIVSLGLLVSSLTDNQFAAGITSLMIILLGVVLNNAYDSIRLPALRTILKAVFDFGGRISALMSGSFDLTCVLYFISLTILFLYLTTQSLLRTRYTISKKSMAIGAYSLIGCVMAIAIITIINIAAAFLPAGWRTVDVTANRLYSVSEESRFALKDLKDDIALYYLTGQDAGDLDENVIRVLEDYEAGFDNISLEYVDTVINPGFAATYTEDNLESGSVIVVNRTNGKSVTIDYYDLIKTAINYSNMTQYITGYDVEGCVTNAIQLVCASDNELTKVYATTGHGELIFEDDFKKRFSRTGLVLTDLDISAEAPLPDDCKLLIINSPEKDFSEKEGKMILRYLEDGGDLLMICDYTAEDTLTVLNRIAAFYGVKENRGIVIERDPNGYYYSGDKQAQFYIFPLVCKDLVTEGILDSKRGSVFVPLSEAFTYETREDTDVFPLLISSDQAYLKKDLTNTSTEFEAGDEEGTQILALRASRTVSGDLTSTAAFFASALLFSDSANTQVSNGMNLILFGNILNTLAGGETAFATIPVKNFYETLTVTASDVTFWSAFLFIIVILIAGFGVIVFLRRRRL